MWPNQLAQIIVQTFNLTGDQIGYATLGVLGLYGTVLLALVGAGCYVIERLTASR